MACESKPTDRQNRGKWSSPEIAWFFPPFDCVRHFEQERLLPFTLLQLIRGNVTGDSEYRHDPSTPPLTPHTRVHKARGRQPTSRIRRQTASTWRGGGSRPLRQGPSCGSSPAPAPWAARASICLLRGFSPTGAPAAASSGQGEVGPSRACFRAAATSVASRLVGGHGCGQRPPS